MTLPQEIAEQITDTNQNRNAVKCKDCGSLILNPTMASFEQRSEGLPKVHQKNTVNVNELECENFEHFWVVKNMYTFENIGFLNTVDNKKYLICADCERGPVGYHDVQTQINYIAFDRVKHAGGTE